MPLRILDASLNRAAEGLRVVEDYARFELNDGHLSKLSKNLRHELATLASRRLSDQQLHAARATIEDVGTTISTPAEGIRNSAWDVCSASLKRVEQSLRSLEEYGKLIDGEFAAACEQLRYRVYTLEKALDTTRVSAEALDGKSLCVLVDAGEDETSFAKLVETLVNEGVGLIQLRDKRLGDRPLLERAQMLVRATRGSATLAIMNDRADLAAAARADGVHLGQDDLAVADARTIVGHELLIGVSTHSIAQARGAVLAGANYLGAGPTFPSRTKAFEEFPGLDYLRQVASEIALPTFAIGGIDTQNVSQVSGAGIHRIAVSGAVAGTKDAGEAVRRLRSALGFGPKTPVGGLKPGP